VYIHTQDKEVDSRVLLSLERVKTEYEQLWVLLKAVDPNLRYKLPPIHELLRVSDPTTFDDDEAQNLLDLFAGALQRLQPLDLRLVINLAQKALEAADVLAEQVSLTPLPPPLFPLQSPYSYI
jgi:hypothetical protein